MTYCAAWKKNGKAYLVADTAMSSIVDKNYGIETNAFGIKEGKYNNYYVNEAELKIIKVNESMVIAYSGVKENAIEAFEHIKNSFEYFCFKDMLVNTYSQTVDFELLILHYENNENKICHFSDGVCNDVEDFIDIGSGTLIQGFSEGIKSTIQNTDKEVAEHLAVIVSYIQCSLIKNNEYRYGVGGAISGVSLDKMIEWCKDIHYFIYPEDIIDYKYISVVHRFDSLFTASSYNDISKFYISQNINSDVLKSTDNIEYMKKVLYNTFPDYMVFYSKHYNVVYSVRLEKWVQNTGFRIWTRMRNNSIDLAFAFDPLFLAILKSHNATKFKYPDSFGIRVENIPFKKREEFLVDEIKSHGIKILDKGVDLQINEVFDYDLRAKEFSVKEEILNIIGSNVQTYKNIIFMDYDFMCNLIEEKFNLYKKHNIKLNDFDFSKLVTSFIRSVASDSTEDYIIYIIKSESSERYIDDVSFNELFKSKIKCEFIEIEENDYEKMLSSIIYEVLKKYYYDEDYFYLDKIILICDNVYVNDVLCYMPYSNFTDEEYDIILVREMNGLTNMDGRFRYVVIDYAIAYMFGLTSMEISAFESGIDLDEL